MAIKDLGKYVTDPRYRKAVNDLNGQNRLLRMTGVAVTAITDNSTGAAGGPVKEIKPLRKRFAHVTGSDLAQKAAFDTANTANNSAIDTLAETVTALGTPIGIGVIASNDGTVTTPGTIPAVTKTVTGTDGATAVALARSNANSVFANWRDNISTIILGLNRIRKAYGLVPVADIGGGTASSTLALANKVDAAAAVDATGDTISKAWCDTQMTALADNIAYLATKVTEVQTFIAANKPPVDAID